MRAWVWWGLWSAACGGGGEPGPDAGPPANTDAGTDAAVDDSCHDLDEDGAGVGASCERHDCDDTDPESIDQCGRDCDERPQRAGCPCGPVGEVVDCFMGPEGAGPVGACIAGRKECTAEGWGSCEGQWLPREETCDESDNDCDGTIDDGVQNACGGCGGCVCVGIGAEQPFQPDPGGPIVANPDGSIGLDPDWRGPPVLWVANTAAGTVSKLDPRARLELARYRTSSDPDGAPAATAVDLHGHAVVANRVAGGATKILADDCPDQNGDGLVETSAAGDEVLDWARDECVVWNVADLGAASSVASEVRTEVDGNVLELVWIGTEVAGEGTIVEIDSRAGERTGVEILGTDAFALAMGPGGLVWSVGRDGCPVSTDTTTLAQVRYACPPGGSEASALAVDAQGRVWMSGRVARLDPELLQWDEPTVSTTSIGVALDWDGNAFTGEGGAGGFRIDATTLEATGLPGTGGRGWAEDVDGFLWSIDLSTNGAHVLDPVSGEVEDLVPPFDTPDVAGDLTGLALRRVTPPLARSAQAFETCGGNWTREGTRLLFDADLPAGTSIAFRMRQAYWLEGLAEAAWIPVAVTPRDASPIDLDEVVAVYGAEPREFIEVEAVLRGAPPAAGPTLRSVCVAWDDCWIE